jgi:alkanesulfonate monooxygenase SsuD/methylene tetrahydromethanopterin reductase-like flavin-dependent oxidoreductase (luciferase family)
VSLAKAVATLDHLSGGRFVLGVGAGWSAREFETHHHLPASARQDVLREAVEVMRAIWTEDVATFKGRYYDIGPLWSWPKPVQRPHPPILLGGPALPRTFDRVAEWADGWLTMALDVRDDEFPAGLVDLRSRWARAGRDPAALRVTALIPPLGRPELEQTTERAHHLGVQHLMIHLEDTAGDDLRRVLDDVGAVCTSQPR